MAKDKKEINHLDWSIPEYNKHKRNKTWYVLASIITIALLVFAFITANFLFVIIIIMSVAIVLVNDKREPNKVKFSMDGEGIYIGKRFYDYDEFKDFSILYKPKQEMKNIYFEYKNRVKQRISIPLFNNNPLLVRDFLLRYMEEDIDRTDEPLSESLAKFFKL